MSQGEKRCTLEVSSELREFSGQKKGMSPLIATMLLIAFAVALGAMIMNWSSTLGEKSGPDCSAITMVVSPYLCYADNIMKLSVRNTGAPVESVTVKVVDDTGETIKLLPSSNLPTDGTLSRDIPYVKSGKAQVSLVPSIKYKSEVIPCTKPALELDDIPGC